jgi:hypothetical protein
MRVRALFEGHPRVTGVGAVCALIVLWYLLLTVVAVGDARSEGPVVDAGKFGKKQWQVLAEHPSGPEGQRPLGKRRPCLGIAISEFVGEDLLLQRHELCYGKPGYLSASAEPLVVSESLGRAANGDRAFLVAVALPPAVRKYRLDDVDRGPERAFSAESITQKQAREASLRRFRFVVFVLSERECVHKASTINETGGVLWESGDLSCPSRSASSLR